LKDQQVLIGTVAPADGRVEVQTAAGRALIAKGTIEAIRSRDEQARAVAEVERLRSPRLRDLWNG